MRAISIKQPWAWAIIYAGKDIENRSWPTKQMGPVLIHSGKQFSQEGYLWLLNNRNILQADIPHRDDFPVGGIVGKSEIVDCVSYHSSPFFFGPWGFVLKNSEALSFIPYKGRLSFFNIPDDAIYHLL